jgi:hypothetical protein
MNYLRIIRGHLGDRPVTLYEIHNALLAGIAPK